jgi:prepilin-type N-terminal cleavage/methylation domain-containing protein
MKSKYKNLRKNSEGFTIIEVLIVLAIAALILLIVFLAVPALQRSAHNTQRGTDASAVAAAVSNFISNNGGALPTAMGTDSADATSVFIYCAGQGNNISALSPNYPTVNPPLLTGGPDYTACTSTNYETAKLGFYKPADVFVSDDSLSPYLNVSIQPSSTTPSATALTTNDIIVEDGWGCNSSNTGLSAALVSRTAAVLYVKEASGGDGSQACVSA